MVSFVQPENPVKPESDLSKPPKVEDVLAIIIRDWTGKRRSIPECMPKGEYHAASWFLDLMEQPHAFLDTPEPIRSMKTGDISAWRTPYHDRVSLLLHKFLRLSEPHQVFVVEYIGKGVPWRGESIEQYGSICREHGQMLKDPENYIGKTKQVLAEMGVKI